MTISTVGAARHISPTVISTFFKHYFRQAKKSKDDRRLEATDELLFDEAFHIVKRFISLGTADTVEALQAFTNTRIPSQPFTTLVPTLIPLSSCDQAARALIEYFGEEDLKNVVGGERWWQVRGLNGVEAEWVAMTKDWKHAKVVDEMPEREAKARAAKYAKYNKRHERRSKEDLAKARAATNGVKTSALPEAGPSPGKERQVDEEAIEGEEEEDEEEAAAEPAITPLEKGHAEEEVPVEELDRLRRVMLYLHGGGYYFGSCNTHRYQITRLARKMGGRAFCPNYRKAPGFPWPCPLQDCLAAWFYLTDPPPGAGHKAIDPKNIVLAGDSAGGGMCLAVLGVLRDLGLPMPAGAVLISPWCDMTHSFPSIMQNTDTDIIPPYGFIHKPSTLWPVPANTASPGDEVKQGDKHDEPSRHVPKSNNVSPGTQTPKASTGAPGGSPGPEGGATHEPSGPSQPSENSTGVSHTASTANGDAKQKLAGSSGKGVAAPNHSEVPPAPHPLQSEPIRVELSDHNDPIELKQQIQLYATNNQLYHPLCSPILQGSLGGLPPLYILAGDGEVLRDEVIMLAHRAARPEKYPLPEHLLAKNERSRETAERFNSQPTQVHLQVFDYQCHVLTLFSFTTAARFAYRAIASFCKYVTRAETIEAGSLSSSKGSPFPVLAQDTSPSSSVFSPLPPKDERSADGKEVSRTISASRPSPLDTSTLQLRTDQTTESPLSLTPEKSNGQASVNSNAPLPPGPLTTSVFSSGSATRSDTLSASSSAEPTGPSSSNRLPSRATTPAPDASANSSSSLDQRQDASKVDKGESILIEKRRKVTLGVQNDYSGQVPLIRPAYEEHMIRERVDVRGAVRALEPEEELQSIRLFVDHPTLIGTIREGPVRRYLEGQEKWDHRFKKTAKHVEKQRKANEKAAEEMLRKAAERGLLNRGKTGQVRPRGTSRGQARNRGSGGGSSSRLGAERRRGNRSKSEVAAEEWVEEPPRYGPLDVCLAGETPPPSALAGRRDCDDSITLLRTSLRLSSKEAGKVLGRRSKLHDDLFGVPRQSAAEATKDKGKKSHGLDIWVKGMGMFGKRTRAKAYFEDNSTPTAEDRGEAL